MFSSFKKKQAKHDQLANELKQAYDTFDLEVALIHLSRHYNNQQIADILNGFINNSANLLCNGRIIEKKADRYKSH